MSHNLGILVTKTNTQMKNGFNDADLIFLDPLRCKINDWRITTQKRLSRSFQKRREETEQKLDCYLKYRISQNLAYQLSIKLFSGAKINKEQLTVRKWCTECFSVTFISVTENSIYKKNKEGFLFINTRFLNSYKFCFLFWKRL